MKAINPYLTFDGTAREAMTWYAKILGAKLEMQSFKDAGMVRPEDDPNRIIHANLKVGDLVVMASDSPKGTPVHVGDNAWVSVDCDNVPEIEKLFKAFSEGSQIKMPLQDMFWGAKFGMITDKFGTGWMFNCYVKKS